MLDLLCSRACTIHRLCHRAYLLPFVMSKCRRVSSTKSLLFIFGGSSIITWSKCGINLVPKHGRGCILWSLRTTWDGVESYPRSYLGGRRTYRSWTGPHANARCGRSVAGGKREGSVAFLWFR